MLKIKDIVDRLEKNPGEFSEIRLLMAKRTLAFFIMLYFTAYLFTIGGFSFWMVSLRGLSAISYHAYSVLIIVIGWFLYELEVYISYVYTGGKKWPIFLFLFFGVIFVCGNLFVHLFA